MRRCFIIFAKEPRKGGVKTRLKKFFSEGQLLNLYKAFLKDTLDIAKKVKCEAKILAFSSTGRPHYLKRRAGNFIFYKQKGKDLGERMYNTFKYAKNKEAEKTIIIGSDSPTLPLKFINDAFIRLNKNDIVLGPSNDGGYYLIGLKQPCVEIFKDIQWSSKTVFVDTLKIIKRLKKTLSILPYWYDVDDPSALVELKQDLKKRENSGIAKWTKQFLNKFSPNFVIINRRADIK